MRTSILAAFLMTAAVGLPQAAAGSSAVDTLFAGVDHRDTPGCVLDVRRSGHIIYQRAYGMADLEGGLPITPSTVFEAGSVSKQFVAAAVAVLASTGRLSMDDSVRRFIPELPELYAPVTVRMLLNHTSGVRNWDSLAELTGWPGGTRVYDQAWALRTLARQSRLNFRPGDEYLYSNGNYVLAAVVVERASGRSLDAFSQEALFAPLGLTHTRWRSDFRAVVPGRAQAYQASDGGSWRLDMPFEDVVGPGGLLTTAEDMQRWNAALDHPRPQDRAWMALLATPGQLNDGARTRYGLGLELDPVAGVPALSHAGATASYRAWLGRFPGDGLSVALLCNAGSLNTEDLGPQVAAAFLPTPEASAADLAPAPGAGPPPSGVAGLYRNLDTDAAVEATADGDAIRFAAGPPLRASGPDLLSSLDHRRTASVERRTDGSVLEVTLTRPGNSKVRLERVEPWAPSQTDLKMFEGAYRSRDAEGDQRITVASGELRWIDPAQGDQPLAALYREAFEAPQSSWTLRFSRDGLGRVDGFDASITRARRIHFDKVR